MTRLDIEHSKASCQNDTIMTNTEYERLRKHINMTRPYLSEVMGVSISTIIRREKGTVEITREAARAMRSLVAEREEFLGITAPKVEETTEGQDED